MKKFILIALVVFSASYAFSQSDKEEIDLYQAAFGMDKKATVAEFVHPSVTQKDAFWKIYDEYETKRKELGKQRIELLKQYANEYQKMNSEQADAWTKKVIALQQKTDKLIAEYYTKVKGISNGLVATQFYQIENFILTAIRAEILQEVPFLPKKN
jgi:hypothetical protein